jgi:hypothetical protein
MIHKNGKLHEICVGCIEKYGPTHVDCQDCEKQMREEVLDYPGDCK